MTHDFIISPGHAHAVERSGGVVWFAAPGFRLIAMNDAELDVVIEIETDVDRVGCQQCGVIEKCWRGWPDMVRQTVPK